MLAINLGCGRQPRESTPDTQWANVDVLDLPGVDERVDLFAYPWPWEAESVDHFYSRHLLEHIPHTTKRNDLAMAHFVRASKADLAMAYLSRLYSMDGLFAFFAEAWRCLKIGGTIESEVPWPLSMETWSDPTHTRAITPQTITYLTNPQTTREDYLLPFLFEQHGAPLFSLDSSFDADLAASLLTTDDLVVRAQREWGVCHYWSFTLRKVPR